MSTPYRTRQIAAYRKRKADRRAVLRQLREAGMSGDELAAMRAALHRHQQRDGQAVFGRQR